MRDRHRPRISAAVRCWGGNLRGQLGTGNIVSFGDNEPASMSPLVSLQGQPTRIASFGNHTCSIDDVAEVLCWGEGTFGQLGYGNLSGDWGDDESVDSGAPVSLSSTPAEFATGTNHTCAVYSANAVHCWGSGANGRLGYANTNNIGDNESPSSLPLIQL